MRKEEKDGELDTARHVYIWTHIKKFIKYIWIYMLNKIKRYTMKIWKYFLGNSLPPSDLLLFFFPTCTFFYCLVVVNYDPK